LPPAIHDNADHPADHPVAAQAGNSEPMNIVKRKGNPGFTVIELMIVIVILSILVALAYPSYVQYVRKANRGDAQQLLMNWAVNQEIWRSNHPAYAPISDDPAVGIPAPTHDRFTFTAAIGTNTYTLQAEATGDQANDQAKTGNYCGKSGSLLTIDEAGAKAPDGCWD